MTTNNKLKTVITFDSETNNKIESMNNQALQADHQPLVALFALLLEWDIKDVQEKERKSKSLSTPSQYANH
ncbi:MAG: hypothetical protein NTX86_05360 [Candidatus Dependentiae bacterium]|nr:hypothetical protein [Candidatus Dependentiae bacterium]